MNGKLARSIRRTAAKLNMPVRDLKRSIRYKHPKAEPKLTGFFGARKFPWRNT